MLRQLYSRSFRPSLLCNVRMLSTSALCKQQGKPRPSPWLNLETRVEARSPEEKNQQEREDLAASYRGLAYYGLSEGTCNHLTSRAPAKNGDGEVMLIVKYGMHWTEVTASSLLGVSFENGKVLEGDGEPEITAVEIHSAVYRHAVNSNHNVKAVFHTHPPYSTTLACLEDSTLEMISQNAARFFDDIAYDKGYQGLASTGHEGDRLAKELGGKSVAFMGNHGVLVTGESTAEAFDKTYYLERAAQLQVLAMSTGRKMSKLSDDLSKFVKQQVKDDAHFLVPAHFNSIKRILPTVYPGDFTS